MILSKLKHAIPFDLHAIEESFLDTLRTQHVVLFGEIHGTKECPAVFAAMVKALSSRRHVIVGLELPTSLKASISLFMKNGDLDGLAEQPFFQQPALHTGRGSEAILHLLEELRCLNNVAILCFDTGSDGSRSRDTLMAEFLWKNLSSHHPLLVLSGNIHTRLSKGVPWNQNFKTMGSELLCLSKGELHLANTSSYLFRCSGYAWNCQRDACGEHQIHLKRGYDNSPEAMYILEETLSENDGHSHSFFLGKVRPSPPWKG